MWAHAASTLKQAATRPALWVLSLLGVGAGWFGLELSVLALGDAGEQAQEMIGSTALATGALAALWLLAAALEADRASGFRPALDACGPGVAGRLAGRWLAATLGGTVAGGLVASLLVVVHGGGPQTASLYFAIIAQTALVAAWGLLLGRLWSGGVVVVGGLALWLVGHLPLGTPALWPGPLGRALAAWLPGAAADAAALVAQALAAAGLVAVSLSLARGQDSAA